MEDKGYHKHKVAKTFLLALHLGFNSLTFRLIHFWVGKKLFFP